jgi:hypothetical protein
MGSNETLPELLLFAHPPHVLAILFRITLHSTASQLVSDRATDMALVGLQSLVAHLALQVKMVEKEQKQTVNSHTWPGCAK